MADSSERAQEVAGVYAEALYGLARQAGRVAAVRAELEELVRLVETLPGFADFVQSSVLGSDQRQAGLERMFRGRLSELVLHTLLVMNEHGRAGLLPALLRRFVLCEEHDQGQVEVMATSAIELEAGHRRELERWAAEVSGLKPLVQYVVDPAVGGGLVVQIGDHRFDYTVRRHLAAARAQLLERSERGLGIQVGR